MSKLNQNDLNEGLSHENQKIISEWFQFFKDFKSGCTFAALIARRPERFGWFALVVKSRAEQIASALKMAIEDPEINTLSLIFPQVKSQEQLEQLIAEVQKVNSIWIEFAEEFGKNICIGLRLKIDNNISWITGFGDFDFLPKTRQAPYTSLTLRVKPKPVYEWVMKPSEPNELHLADINVNIIAKAVFENVSSP